MRRVFKNVLLMGLLLFPALLDAAEAPRLLILPFEISSPEPLDYLRESLPDLLASRVGQGSEVAVVPPAQVMQPLRGRPALSPTDPDVQALARLTSATHLLSGRFTKIGDAFSLDAELLEVASGRSLGRVTVEGEGMSRLIPKVGELSELIRKRLAPAAPVPPPPPVAKVTPPPPAVAAPVPPPAVAQPTLPPAGPPSPGLGVPGKAWFSRPLPIEVRGVGVGDVNGDRTSEIVLLTKKEVQLYRWEAKDISLLTRYAAGISLELLGVDVADLNGNGREEIYVTALAPGNALASFVLEWSGSELKLIASSLPWYLRLIHLADGPALVGQRRGHKKVFDGPIRRLLWQGRELVPGEALPLPGFVALFSFAMADLDGDGRPEVASLQPRSPLTIYNSQGKVLAKGSAYGQTDIYMVEVPGKADESEEGFTLPGRILAVDLPGQGSALVVGRNHEFTRIFQRLRTFTNGEVIALTWSEGDIAQLWQTEQLAYVADFQVSSRTSRGEPFLIVGTVTDFGGTFSSPSSRLVLIPLGGVSSQ